MHGEHKIVWSFVGILLVCGALGLTIQQSKQRDTPAMEARVRNLSNAGRIEIRDRAKQRVLYGEFRSTAPATSTDVAHAAQLMAASGDAVGRAEIELAHHPNGALVQELEVDVAGLLANAIFDVAIDGEWIGAFMTDRDGNAELERFGRVGELIKAAD